ncbi:uncharacterized protein DUF4198 [Azomonas agilis]|uniref:Uncharacterized protein DUF4198 n=1 Tax=Azomonas agilis TaxID=116849 RepID=A0A562J0F3_9GAMM|nr:DUF4198 domain-containing protein [Azomonas agilis]TWH76590.1 uncharacterized protein DUF4198 [Azomonas agilis]
MFAMSRTRTLLASLVLVAPFAQAHMLWLERPSDSLTQAYFGEFVDDVRETQAGPLKRFEGLKALQAGKTLDSQAKDSSFDFATSGSADVRLSKALVHKDTRVIFDAKAGRHETKADDSLTLELVPEAADSNTLTLMFQGKPLAKTEVTAVSPQKWSKSFRTDEQGKITLETPWPGIYVLEVAHTVEAKGEQEGKTYEKTRYVHTLSLLVPEKG